MESRVALGLVSGMRKSPPRWATLGACSASWWGCVGNAKPGIAWFVVGVVLCAAPAFAQPGAVGDLYIIAGSDSARGVLQFDPDSGKVLGYFVPPGSVPPGNDGLRWDSGLAFGPNGNLFAVNKDDNVVEFDGATGAPIGVFAAGGVERGNGLAFAPGGNLFVSSYVTHNVVEYDGTTGELVRTIGGGELYHPRGLTFGPNGNLFVCSEATDTVIEYVGTTGELVGTFASGGGLVWPHDLTFGPNGNLFVTSYATQRVVEYDGASGDLIGTFTIINPGQMQDGWGLVFGPEGDLFVSREVFGIEDVLLKFNGQTGDLIALFPSIPEAIYLRYMTIKQTPVPLPAPQITAFDPPQADNCGVQITATVSGTGLVAGATVELVRTGEPNVVGTVVNVAPDTELTVELDLGGAAPGMWDVVLT